MRQTKNDLLKVMAIKDLELEILRTDIKYFEVLVKQYQAALRNFCPGLESLTTTINGRDVNMLNGGCYGTKSETQG